MANIETMIVELEKLTSAANAGKSAITTLITDINILNQSGNASKLALGFDAMSKTLRENISYVAALQNQIKNLSAEIRQTQSLDKQFGVRKTTTGTGEPVIDGNRIIAESTALITGRTQADSKDLAVLNTINLKLQESLRLRESISRTTSGVLGTTGTGSQSIYDAKAVELKNNLRNQYFPGGAAPVGNIGQPPETTPAINLFKERLATLSAEMQRGITGFLGNRKATNLGGPFDMGNGIKQLDVMLEGTTTPIKVFVSALGNAARSLEALALADKKSQIQSQVRTDPRYAQLNALAKKVGNFDPKDLQSLVGGGHGVDTIDRQTGRVVQIPSRMEATYSKIDPNGVEQRQKFMVGASGNAVTETSRKFRDFTESMRNNLFEMAKWTLAVGLIYGPMRKLSEFYQIMVENESKLADVSVIVNANFQSQKDTFESVSKSAMKYGEELSNVIDAYGQAYKAVGSRTTPQTRGEDATALLEASLALSKLSNMDETQSIDILTAALAQTNTEFKDSTDIIDKWVRVAREAKVDVADLATGTAMLGDAAETAGLSTDQLNALISTMAQVSPAGAKESANTLKMLFSNISAERTEAALRNIGLTSKDTTDELLGTWDILMRIISANQAGLISPDELNKLGAEILGPRQGKNLVSMINAPDILMQAFNTSENGPGGETEAAMAKKMATTKTATTNLANAFGILAGSLGTEGGILDSTANLLDVFTKLVLQIDKATQFFGKATPALIAFGVAALALKGKTSGVGNWVETSLVKRGIGVDPGYNDSWGGRGPGGYSGLGNLGPQTGGSGFAYGAGQIAQKYGGAAAVTGGIALSNVMSGQKEAAVGAVIGGAVGAALIPFAPTIGAMIGSTAGSAFVGFVTKDVTLADWFADSKKPAKDEGGKVIPKTDAEKALDSIYLDISQREKYVVGGTPSVERGMQVAAYESIFSNLRNSVTNLFTGTNLPTNQTAVGIARKYGDPTNVGIIDKETAATQAEGVRTGVETSPFDIAAKKLETDNAEFLSRITLDASKNLRDKMNAQEISPVEFGKSTAALGGLGNFGSLGITAFGDALDSLSPKINGTKDLYEAFLKLLTEGNPEQKSFITAYIGEIGALTIELAAATDAAEKLRLTQALTDAQTNAAAFMDSALKGIDTTANSEFQVQRYPDTTYPGRDALMAQYDKEKALYQEKFPKYQIKEEDLGLQFKGNVTDILHVDLRLLQIAMDKLIDVNEKQLDGIYNLPQGAYAMIPAGAARMMHDTLEAGGELPTPVPPEGVPPETPEKSIHLIPLPKNRDYKPGITPTEDLLTHSGTPVRTPTPPPPPPVTETGLLQQMIDGSANERSLLQQILDAINSGFSRAGVNPIGTGIGTNPIGTGMGMGIGPEGTNTNIFSGTETTSQPLPVTTRFDIKFESTTQLIVDGRTLAEVIKPYLAEDLQNTNDSQGTTTRSYVI